MIKLFKLIKSVYEARLENEKLAHAILLQNEINSAIHYTDLKNRMNYSKLLLDAERKEEDKKK